jgi:hypothetical protein
LGLLLHAIVHPADIQDRDGGILVMANLFGMFPFVKKLFADGGYQGPTARAKLPHDLAELAPPMQRPVDPRGHSPRHSARRHKPRRGRPIAC